MFELRNTISRYLHLCNMIFFLSRNRKIPKKRKRKLPKTISPISITITDFKAHLGKDPHNHINPQTAAQFIYEILKPLVLCSTSLAVLSRKQIYSTSWSSVLSFRRRPRKSSNPCRARTDSIQDEFRPLNLVEKNVQFKKSWASKGKRMARLARNKTKASLPILDYHQHHNQEPLLKEKLTPSKKSCEQPSCEVKTSGQRKMKITFEKKVVLVINIDDQDRVMSHKTTDSCPPSSSEQQTTDACPPSSSEQQTTDACPPSSEQQQQQELPLGLKNYIKELGASGDPVLVIQKRLFASDVKRGLQRLLIPVRQVVNHGFLTVEERSRFNSKDKQGGIDAILIEPSLAKSGIKLRKWYMSTSENYVLVRGWNQVVTRNGLKAGQIVQLWSFKKGLQLYFVLVRLW